MNYYALNRFWDQQRNGNGRPSLLVAIAKTFWKEYSIYALLCLINDVVLKIAQPQLLRIFLLYFKYDIQSLERKKQTKIISCFADLTRK